MQYLVYTLSDPETDELRYVGMTTKPLNTRLNGHFVPSTLKKEENHRTHWLRLLRAKGVKPKIELLEGCVGLEQMREAERFWIEQLRALGFRLVNTTDGGEGIPGLKMSDETRARMSEARRKNWQDPAFREHMLAHRQSPQRRKAVGEQAKARWADPEKRAEILEAMKGRRARPGRPFIDQFGRIYNKIAEAAAVIGAHTRSVARALASGKPLHGYVFTHVEKAA